MNPSKIRERKCSTCKHYQASPLWRKGWCRNPLLYDRNTNHLVEADSLACNRTFIDYWEPITGPTPMGPTNAAGRTTPKPRIAPSIPMEMTDARGQRVTRTGITPMNGMTAVTAEEADEALADEAMSAEVLTYPDLDFDDPDFEFQEASQSTLELEQVEAAARNGSSGGAATSGLTKAQQRANAAAADKGKSTARKPKVARPPQRPIIFGMGRDRLILIGVTALALIVALLSAIYLLGPKPPVVPAVTPTATARPEPSPTGFGDPTATVPPEPTFTTAPPPPSDVIAVNGWVQVSTNSLTLRDLPTTDGARLGTLRSGTNGHVIDGPVEANGYTWWKIDSYDGTNPTASGWCAGEFLIPIPPP